MTNFVKLSNYKALKDKYTAATFVSAKKQWVYLFVMCMPNTSAYNFNFGIGKKQSYTSVNKKTEIYLVTNKYKYKKGIS